MEGNQVNDFVYNNCICDNATNLIFRCISDFPPQGKYRAGGVLRLYCKLARLRHCSGGIDRAAFNRFALPLR